MFLAELEVHFQKMKQIGEQTDEVATDLQRILEEYGRWIAADTESVWEGEGASVFRTLWAKQLGRLEESVRLLKLLSADISQKANRIYEAEKRNEVRAVNRNYSGF